MILNLTDARAGSEAASCLRIGYQMGELDSRKRMTIRYQSLLLIGVAVKITVPVTRERYADFTKRDNEHRPLLDALTSGAPV